MLCLASFFKISFKTVLHKAADLPLTDDILTAVHPSVCLPLSALFLFFLLILCRIFAFFCSSSSLSLSLSLSLFVSKSPLVLFTKLVKHTHTHTLQGVHRCGMFYFLWTELLLPLQTSERRKVPSTSAPFPVDSSAHWHLLSVCLCVCRCVCHSLSGSRFE